MNRSVRELENSSNKLKEIGENPSVPLRKNSGYGVVTQSEYRKQKDGRVGHDQSNKNMNKVFGNFEFGNLPPKLSMYDQEVIHY